MKTLILALILSQTPAVKAPVVGVPSSHVYHTEMCVHYKTCKTCTAGFKTVEEAKAAGYHACPFIKKAVK